MVLSKVELIHLLQHEVHILLHLTTKIDRAKLDYRPTGKQRSTLELLRYLSFMGPEIVADVKNGSFDPAKWGAAQKAADGKDFDQVLETIGGLSEKFASLVNSMPDADFRTEIEMFGNKASRGAQIISIVLAGYAAYRTQIFLYLKSCGREELGTMNLWAGMDAPVGA